MVLDKQVLRRKQRGQNERADGARHENSLFHACVVPPGLVRPAGRRIRRRDGARFRFFLAPVSNPFRNRKSQSQRKQAIEKNRGDDSAPTGEIQVVSA